METLVVLGHFAKWSQQLMGEAGVGEVQEPGFYNQWRESPG